MNYAKEANKYLGVKFLKAPIYSDTELKKAIGVSLNELMHLWIFESKNNFKDSVELLVKDGIKIIFELANEPKSEPYIPF